MRRGEGPGLGARSLVAAAWGALALAGCGEKIDSSRPSAILGACCDAARARIELARDMETASFQRRCGACRQGNTTRACASAAEHVQTTVKQAYSSEPWPVECSTLRSQLGELGISISENR